MPQEAIVWGIKNLKKTEKYNYDTGVKQEIKRCTGVIEFPVLADQAGIYEDKKVFIYTEEEHMQRQNEKPDLYDVIKSLAEASKTILLTQQDFDNDLRKVLEYIQERV